MLAGHTPELESVSNSATFISNPAQEYEIKHSSLQGLAFKQAWVSSVVSTFVGAAGSAMFPNKTSCYRIGVFTRVVGCKRLLYRLAEGYERGELGG